MTALLSVTDVHISYGKVEAVRSVSLDVAPNEIVTIIGANGAGKTTLLNAIMGVLPLKGRTTFAGVDMAPLDIEDRVATGLSLVPEHRELFSTMDVEDEPSLGLAPIIVADIFRIVGELRAAGVSVLLVEQNAQAALQIADRAYVMELGEFVLAGPATEIAANKGVAASYLGFQHEGESAI